MSFIEVSKLTKAYGQRLLALDQVSFSVDKGEWVAVMGPSGSGKTTLLNIVGCLDTPSAGAVIIDGMETTGLGQKELTRFRRDNIGLVFQQFHTVSYLTALENVMIAQYYHSMADEAEATEALERVGLGDRLQHLPSQLSGGEKQRLCIARALINQPKLILADEPTGNLDAENEQIVLELFRKLKAEGHTLMVVTHDPSVGRRADRVLSLDHGKLTDFQISPIYSEEDQDEILELMWSLGEESKEMQRRDVKTPKLVDNEEVLQGLIDKGFVSTHNGQVTFTEKGKVRAKDLIRRHRLAECLFFETLGMKKRQMESNACVFEHILNPHITDRICTFLGHPRTCPHGKPIPEGDCCKKSFSV